MADVYGEICKNPNFSGIFRLQTEELAEMFRQGVINFYGGKKHAEA